MRRSTREAEVYASQAFDRAIKYEKYNADEDNVTPCLNRKEYLKSGIRYNRSDEASRINHTKTDCGAETFLLNLLQSQNRM